MDGFSSSTTTTDLLKDIKAHGIISRIIRDISITSDKDEDEIALDTATLVATRLDYVWKSTMSQEEAEMEGIADASEENVATVTKLFQEKYGLSDKTIGIISDGLASNINESSLARGRMFIDFTDVCTQAVIHIIDQLINVSVKFYFTAFPEKNLAAGKK